MAAEAVISCTQNTSNTVRLSAEARNDYEKKRERLERGRACCPYGGPSLVPSTHVRQLPASSSASFGTWTTLLELHSSVHMHVRVHFTHMCMCHTKMHLRNKNKSLKTKSILGVGGEMVLYLKALGTLPEDPSSVSRSNTSCSQPTPCNSSSQQSNALF